MNKTVLIGTALSVFCLWMLRYSLKNLKKADASMRWPSVEGRLANVELWGTRNIDGEMKAAEKISVKYEYSVGGKTYTSTRLAFYTLVYPETVDFANAHAVNSKISVFYQPNDPSQSVLVPGAKGGNKRYSEVILALMGSVASVFVVVMSLAGGF